MQNAQFSCRPETVVFNAIERLRVTFITLLFVKMSTASIVRCLCVFAVIFAGICVVSAETGKSCNGDREDDDDTITKRQRPSEGQCGLSDKDLPDLEAAFDDMALIPGGYYSVGTDEPMVRGDNEGPARRVHVSSFFIDRHEVSNEAFMKFTDDTGYVTDAEHYDDSFVFEYFLTREERYQFKDRRAAAATWWYKVMGANWRHPEGMYSSIKGSFCLFFRFCYSFW